MAAEENNLGAAKILIEYGANISISNGNGETPIDLFRQYGNEEAVNYLQYCLDITGNDSSYLDII
ncbi:MAG: ankyrin repeat domain-containing protein [Rickettsia endosymbiont of Pentastiridius leporinus]